MRLVAIVVVTVLAHAAFNASRITVSLYALSLGASALAVGAMMSLYAALPMVLAVPAGRFVDRVGVRRPLVASAFVLALGVALPGLLPGIEPLYFAAAVIGTAFMVFHIGVQHLVGEMSAPHERQANFGWLALGFSISNFLGPLTAGLAIDNLGHSSAFLLESALALAALALVVARRSRLRHEPHAQRSAGAGSLRELLADPELRRVFFFTGILASAWDLFVFAMPIYGTAIGLSATTIGLVIGSFALATFTVRLALPVLSRRAREWTLITATLFVAGSAYALLPLMRTVPLLALTAFVLGLGLGATQPSIMSLLYATAPAGRAAEAIGVRSTVLNASHTFLPLAFGGVGAALGMAPVFWTMSVFLVAGGWLAHRRRRLGAS